MAMWVRRLFLLAFLLALALPAASQTQQPNSSGGVIKNCTELVVLDAQVRRRSGETVGTLSREDFTIYEDGIKQQIVHCRRPDLAPCWSGPCCRTARESSAWNRYSQT